MPDLHFSILSAEVRPYAAMPTLLFKLLVSNREPGQEVYSVGLKGQVMIEAMRRNYDAPERERLFELFGEPERWGETMKSILWTYVTVPVPRFTGSTVVDVPVLCGEDLESGAGKFFYAMEEGEVPLSFLFSGTIFYATPDGSVQVSQVPWDREAEFRLPVKVWRDLIDHYYPESRWLRIRKDTFDRLYRYKAEHAFPTLEACIEALIGREMAEGENCGA